MKTLVMYFSAEFGSTAALAKKIADLSEGTLFEIDPAEKYSKKDLNYRMPLARCNKEKIGGKEVPVKGYPDKFEDYDRVFIGFPIWYGGAPNVVKTFCKGLDFSGKKVAVFATSGGSKIGKTVAKLSPCVAGAEIVDGKLFNNTSKAELKSWIDSL